jgi:hypothetical protein
MPILLHFFKDADEIREGSLTYLPDFLETLQASQRSNYVEHFAYHWHQADEEIWRKRKQKAQQIGDFARLVTSSEAMHKHFAPIFFELCND